jgi:hypothetical protein
MPRMRRILLACTATVVGVLLGSAGLGGDPARAELEKAQATTAGVTTYLTVQFSTTRCDDANAYKINMVSRRWRRSSLRRTVRAQYDTNGKGKRCNGDPVNYSSTSEVFKPCFGCDGGSRRWTSDYVSTYTWPYLRQCHCDAESVGALVMTQVKNRRGRSMGFDCVKVPLLGYLDSAIC